MLLTRDSGPGSGVRVRKGSKDEFDYLHGRRPSAVMQTVSAISSRALGYLDRGRHCMRTESRPASEVSPDDQTDSLLWSTSPSHTTTRRWVLGRPTIGSRGLDIRADSLASWSATEYRGSLLPIRTTIASSSAGMTDPPSRRSEFSRRPPCCPGRPRLPGSAPDHDPA
jgi:hypothetical protein